LKVAAQRIARKRAGPVPSSPLSGPQAQEYREGTGVAFWRVENANGNNYFINLLPDGGAHSTDARSPRGFNGRRGRWSAMAEGYAISWEDGERARIGPYDGGHALFGYSSESVGQGPGQFMSPVEQVAPANAEIWRTSFEDTFQSEKVDANKWVTYAPSGIPSNTEIAGFNPENLKIDDGKLVISANDYGMTANGRYLQYTSGILSTQGKFAQVYGYFEIRFRAPEGQGIRPIIWLTSETTGDHIHLIDILGQEPDKAYFESKRGDRDSIDTAELKGTDFSRAFHTIGLRWSPEELITYVNGSERERITGSIPNTPLVLTAGILVGDGKTGPPSGWTPFPAKLEIDYVRAFERNTDFIGLHRSEVAKKRAEAEASFDKETEAYKGRERAYFVEELATLTNQENLRFNGEIASIRSDEQVYAATEYRRLEEEDRTRFEATLSQLERNQTERYEAALSALKAAEQARLDGILANLEAKENSRYEAEFARLKAEEEARRQVELARLRAEEEARRKVAEEARRRAEEEATRIAEERRRAEEEARRIAQVEAQRRAEEEARRQVELAQQREEREAMLAAKAEEARLIAKARARESAEERERKRLERDARMQAAIARKEAEAAAKAQREAEATLATRSTEFERTPAERTAPAPVAIQRSRPTSRGSPPTTGRSIFEDAFEGGPLLGPAWTLGSGLAANSEEEESIPMDGNVSQKNGRLVLVAQNERVIYEGERRSYSGGTVTTTSSIPGSYGYIEFQAKAPMGQGLSSSFRMLDEVTNKEVVAIHISGLEPDRIHMFVNSGESTSMAATWKGTDFSLSFHSVGIAWSNEYLIFYVDGSEIERLNRGVPEGPVKLSFSLGVGGKRGGAVSGWTSFPARFEVESIRFTR
jgi:beta-glucanase (GH16 family)